VINVLTSASANVRELAAELFQFRELLVQMTVRDLLLRYKQSFMGFGWAIFMPLLNTAVFTVIFTRVAPVQTPVPYVLFAYVGLTMWNLTASALRFSVVSLTSNGSLVTKVHFPREIFPFSAVLVALVDAAVATVLLAVLMAYYGIVPGPAVLLLPAVLLVQIIFTAAVALLLAMGNLFLRDIKYVFDIAVMIWMFASSVLYPIENIGGQLGVLIRLNPMTHIIDAYRGVLFQGQAPTSPGFLITAACSVMLLLGSWLWFHATEFKFAESI
jgi:lipopolysaccharide transport system permease protein